MLDNKAVYDKFINLYESSGMTPSQISEKSGVPLTSVNRLLTGETKAPNFFSTCAVIETLGGSVDDIINHPTERNLPQIVDSKYCEQLKDDLRIERRNKTIWITLYMITVIFILSYSIMI